VLSKLLVDPVFQFGIVLILAIVGGYIANRFKLPRVSGYLLVGILISPGVLGLVSPEFLHAGKIVTNFALAVITYSIGGSLRWGTLKKLGKRITLITFFEAEIAFICVILAVTGYYWMVGHPSGTLLDYFAIALLFGAVASPTDPTATLAVVHEYRAKGNFTYTLLGVAASDDALGIMNYSIAIILSMAIMKGGHLHGGQLVWMPLKTILLSIALGVTAGLLLAFTGKKIEGAGSAIILIIGVLFLAFGLSHYFGLDELLTTMSVGATVVNSGVDMRKMFANIEHYYEEIVFAVFFVIAGAAVNLHVLLGSSLLVLVFVASRAAGKFGGVRIGAWLSRAPLSIKKYLGFGLIPQGGIVVGLAYLMSQKPEFSSYSSALLNVTLGATAIHEILGPIFSKYAIEKSGEIKEGGE